MGGGAVATYYSSEFGNSFVKLGWGGSGWGGVGWDSWELGWQGAGSNTGSGRAPNERHTCRQALVAKRKGGAP